MLKLLKFTIVLQKTSYMKKFSFYTKVINFLPATKDAIKAYFSYRRTLL